MERKRNPDRSPMKMRRPPIIDYWQSGNCPRREFEEWTKKRRWWNPDGSPLESKAAVGYRLLALYRGWPTKDSHLLRPVMLPSVKGPFTSWSPAGNAMRITGRRSPAAAAAIVVVGSFFLSSLCKMKIPTEFEQFLISHVWRNPVTELWIKWQSIRGLGLKLNTRWAYSFWWNTFRNHFTAAWTQWQTIIELWNEIKNSLKTLKLKMELDYNYALRRWIRHIIWIYGCILNICNIRALRSDHGPSRTFLWRSKIVHQGLKTVSWRRNDERWT